MTSEAKTSTDTDPLALIEQTRLSTDQALKWLKDRGIHTSRVTLDALHRKGKLARYRQHGRVRIVYLPRDLARAFMEGPDPCPSDLKSARIAKPGTSVARSPGARYEKALDCLESLTLSNY